MSEETPQTSEDRLIRRFQTLLESFVDRTTVVVSGQSEDLDSIREAVEGLSTAFAAFQGDVLRQREVNASQGHAQDAAIGELVAKVGELEQRMAGMEGYHQEAAAAWREIVEALRDLTREIRGEGV